MTNQTVAYVQPNNCCFHMQPICSRNNCLCQAGQMAQLAGIAGNFRGRKLSCIGKKYDFCGENFHGLLPSAAPTYYGENFCEQSHNSKICESFLLQKFPAVQYFTGKALVMIKQYNAPVERMPHSRPQCSTFTKCTCFMLVQWMETGPISSCLLPASALSVILLPVPLNMQAVVSNHWTGLWTGMLDWTAGLDYWTDL